MNAEDYIPGLYPLKVGAIATWEQIIDAVNDGRTNLSGAWIAEIASSSLASELDASTINAPQANSTGGQPEVANKKPRKLYLKVERKGL